MTAGEKRRLLDDLRGAITSSFLPANEIARRSGVDRAAISRFLAGGSLKVESIEKLAPVLGLEIVIKKKKK